MMRVLLLSLTGLVVVLSGCNPMLRYTVAQATTDDCIIRSNGEFCDEADQFPPPSAAVWSLEIRENTTYVYIGDETWVAHQTEGPYSIRKEERASRNLCTTENTRELNFDFDLETLTGTLDERVRTDGPESCGETPFGVRRAYTLNGVTAESL